MLIHPTVTFCERVCLNIFFFFNDTATTEIYTLSLHDALPISLARSARRSCASRRIHSRARPRTDRKSTRLNSSHDQISYAVFCLKKTNHDYPAPSYSVRDPRPLLYRVLDELP